MDIEKAKRLKIGAGVCCPPDRGDKSFYGTVTHVAADESKNIHGTPYIWVTVKRPDGSSGVWSSNRIGEA